MKEEWVKAYSEAHSITTLDDFIYMIDGEAWEASLTSFVEAVPSLKRQQDCSCPIQVFVRSWEACSASGSHPSYQERGCG